MKKFTLKSLSLAGAMALVATGLYAQTPIITPVGVTARLADQLIVTKTSDVDFGGIFIPKVGDVVATMDYTGKVTITSGTTSLYMTNLQHQGQLKVEADQSATFTVDYPANVTLNSGANILTYNPALFEADGTAIAMGNAKNYSTTLGADQVNSFLINVAGDLAVPGVAKPGIYIGAVNVTVTWE